MSKISRSLKEEKYNDVYQAYSQIIKKYGDLARDISKNRICEEVAKSQAPKFYVNPEWVRMIIKNPKMRKTRKAWDIYKKYLQLKDHYTNKYELYIAIAESQAPSFYYTPDHISRIINHKMKNHVR